MATSTDSARKRKKVADEGGRVSRACVECSRRKAKCDSIRPRCSACASRDLACVFSERKKPGPPKGFVRASNDRKLLEKIDRLETLLLEKTDGSRDPGSATSEDQTWQEITPIVTPDEMMWPFSDLDLDSIPSNVAGRTETAERKSFWDFDVESILGEMEAEPAQVLDLPFDPLRWTGTNESQRLLSMDGGEDSELQTELITLYFSRANQLFPNFPTDSRSGFLKRRAEGDVNEPLVDAMCAFSARFSNNPRLSINNPAHAGDGFYKRAKAAHIAHIHDENFKLDLDVIKTSLLLSLYEVTRFPGLKAWPQVGETVRFAYELELYRVDRFEASKPFWEQEMGRCVWWSIWSLDTYFSAISSRPYAIDSRGVDTCLPSNSYDDLVSDCGINSKAAFLNDDLSRAWKDVSDLELSSTADYQRLYIIILYFLREACDLRRLQMSNKPYEHEIRLLENSFSSFQFALPDLLHKPGVPTTGQDEKSAAERMKIESLILVSQTSLVLTMPIKSDYTPSFVPCPTFYRRWHKCTQAASDIRDIVRDIPPPMLSKLTPTAFSTFVPAGIIISLQMAISHNTQEREYLLSGIEMLLAALKRAGNIWESARAFYDLLASFSGNLSDIQTITDVVRILNDWRGPYVKTESKGKAPRLSRDDSAASALSGRTVATEASEQTKARSGSEEGADMDTLWTNSRVYDVIN